MLEVYAFPRSRSSRVLWTLEELGLDYLVHKVDLGAGEHLGSAYRSVNPAARVPALVDDGRVLTESGAICTYLADRHPEQGLVPEPRTWERALYDRWCQFVLTELEQPLWTIGKHTFALPEKYRVPAVRETARWEFTRAAAVLEPHLSQRETMLDSGFSVVDILTAHTLAWADFAKAPMDYPAVAAYASRMLARPAHSRARAREDAL